MCLASGFVSSKFFLIMAYYSIILNFFYDISVSNDEMCILCSLHMLIPTEGDHPRLLGTKVRAHWLRSGGLESGSLLQSLWLSARTHGCHLLLLCLRHSRLSFGPYFCLAQIAIRVAVTLAPIDYWDHQKVAQLIRNEYVYWYVYITYSYVFIKTQN